MVSTELSTLKLVTLLDVKTLSCLVTNGTDLPDLFTE